MKNYPIVLTIAGSDPSGGAGIQADLKTFAALQCYGLSVITCITAQNSLGVKSVFPLPAGEVQVQLETLLEDFQIRVIKIGMLFSAEIISTVSTLLSRVEYDWLIVDPLLLSSSGHPLLQHEALDVFKTKLLPMANIITPNLHEAEFLSGQKFSENNILSIARKLRFHPGQFVLITGGHLPSDKIQDYLYLPDKDQVVAYSHEKIQSKNNHGTGCTLSSALTSYLARNYAPEIAVQKAIDYVTQSIRYGKEFIETRGNGPLHHFYHWWNK